MADAYDDEYDFDGVDPEPEVEGEFETAQAIVPPPEQDARTEAVPLPRARRVLKDEVKKVTSAIGLLKKLELGEAVVLDGYALDSLVCGATDATFPLDDTGPLLDRLRDQAKQGRFRQHLPLALDEMEDVLATLEAALAALKVASLLDEPISGTWANLHPVHLARKLNQLGHTLLRGRIAGVQI